MVHRFLRGLASLLLCWLLAACGFVSDWFGKGDDPPLPGKRIAILTDESALQVDSSIACSNPAWRIFSRKTGTCSSSMNRRSRRLMELERWLAPITTGLGTGLWVFVCSSAMAPLTVTGEMVFKR